MGLKKGTFFVHEFVITKFDCSCISAKSCVPRKALINFRAKAVVEMLLKLTTGVNFRKTEKLLKTLSYEKAARKMLAKLTTVVEHYFSFRRSKLLSSHFAASRFTSLCFLLHKTIQIVCVSVCVCACVCVTFLITKKRVCDLEIKCCVCII